MSCMATRRSREDRWAAFVLDAATAWGHTGEAFHDRKRHVATFTGLGDVPLGDPDGRIAGYVEEQQRNEMARRCHRLLEQYFQVSPDWVTGDAELDRAICRELIGIRKSPTSARCHAGVARFGRRLGIEGWEQRWRWAADRYVADGTARRYVPDVVAGVYMWLEIGDTERVVDTADLILRHFDPTGDEADLGGVHETELTNLVMAVWWRDGRVALASVVERRPDFGGNTQVEAFALAAVAAETGLVDELREQLARLDQMHRSSVREIGPHAVHDGHDIEYIVGAVRSWLAELDPTAGEPPAAEPETAPTRVSNPTPMPGTTSLAWRGDVLVAEGASGTVAIDIDGRPALAPPPTDDPTTGMPAVDRLRSDDDTIVLERADGAAVTLPSDWDDDQLEVAHQLEVTWSPAGDLLAVWGEYGPIAVFTADGSPAGRYHDHWTGPTYGVVLGAGRMMSWARDGRAVVYDLEPRLVVGAVQMNGWPEDAAMDVAGRIVLTFDNVDGWLAHDIDSGERLGPIRPATRAVMHPTRPIVGYADADQIWSETYGP